MSSIAKRPNNQWRARYRDHEGVEHASHFRTRADAQRWLDQTTADLMTGRYVHPRTGTITLGDYYRRYADRQLWRSGTRRAMDHAVTTCPLADVPIATIARADVELWVKAMSDRGLAASTIGARLTALRTVLNAATSEHLIFENPSTAVRPPRATTRARRMVLPTPEQVDNLIDVADSQLAMTIHLAAHAGLRLGEIRGLQVRDLDFKAGILAVRRQVQNTTGGGYEECEPKYGSVRTLTMNDAVARPIRRNLVAQGTLLAATAWIVAGHHGQPVHTGTLARSWARAKLATGADPTLHLHDLRHYFASMLIADGVDVVTVQHALGHAKASTTLDVYAHLWTSNRRNRDIPGPDSSSPTTGWSGLLSPPRAASGAR